MEDIFCQISNKKMPAFLIAENKRAMAFLDHQPFLPGHTLIITKEHADDVFSLLDEQFIDVCQLARWIALALRSAFGYQDIAIFSNNGPKIQDIRHFHLHVTGKNLDMTRISTTSRERDLVKNQEKLIKAIRNLGENSA